MSGRGEEESFLLRHTNVNHPQLQHSSSKQSVSAEEDYQSAASSRAVSPVSQDVTATPTQPRPYTTPPTTPPPNTTATADTEKSPSGGVPLLPSTQDKMQRLRDSVGGAGATIVRPGEQQIRRKPVGSVSSSDDIIGQRSSAMNRETSPPTPGVDNTPYIHFALDQLTRDEEVRGSRVYPTRDRWSTQPLLVRSAEPSNYDPQSPTAARGSNGITAGEVGTGLGAGALAVGAGALAGEEMRKSDRSAYAPVTANPFMDPVSREATPPFNTPPETRAGPVGQTETSSPMQSEVFVPFDQEVPALRFLPAILRPIWLGIYIFLILLVNIGLIAAGAWSGRHLGLYQYTQFGGPRYFVFEYLPLIIGMFMLVWLFQIQIAVQRIAPFIGMASYSAKARSEAPLMQQQPTNFLLPKLFYFRGGQPVIGACMFIFWLQIFTIPLFSVMFNVYFFGQSKNGGWRWDTVQGVVWTLFTLYFLLLVGLVVLGLYIWRRRTGLKWDPRSIADLVALLDRSNIASEYEGTETLASLRDFRQRLDMRNDRIGYWVTNRHSTLVFYGIGEEGGATRRYSINNGKVREKPAEEQYSPPRPVPVDLGSDESLNTVRSRYLPWYMRLTWLLLWSVAGIVLYLAFLIVSWVHDAVVHGFKPLLHVASNSAGFSSTNFCYSIVPCLIAHIIFLMWLSVDYSFRRLQPYAALSAGAESSQGYVPMPGASAEDSLLLDYPARLPFSITLSAILSRHYQVAWFSLLTLLASTFPILAGGCFWAQFYIPNQEVRVAVETSGFYTLCVFLGIFAFSLPLTLIGIKKRKLPHACTTLAEQFSWIYASRLLGESQWRSSLANKIEVYTRLTSSADRGQNFDGSRYVFGRFVGRDGKIHLGIDRVGRNGSLTRRPMGQTQGQPLIQGTHPAFAAETSAETGLPVATPDARKSHGLGLGMTPPSNAPSSFKRVSDSPYLSAPAPTQSTGRYRPYPNVSVPTYPPVPAPAYMRTEPYSSDAQPSYQTQNPSLTSVSQLPASAQAAAVRDREMGTSPPGVLRSPETAIRESGTMGDATPSLALPSGPYQTVYRGPKWSNSPGPFDNVEVLPSPQPGQPRMGATYVTRRDFA